MKSVHVLLVNIKHVEIRFFSTMTIMMHPHMIIYLVKKQILDRKMKGKSVMFHNILLFLFSVAVKETNKTKIILRRLNVNSPHQQVSIVLVWMMIMTIMNLIVLMYSCQVQYHIHHFHMILMNHTIGNVDSML